VCATILGPKAHLALAALTNFNVQSLPFMNHIELVLDGKYPCLVTRCGYTGEDGFEISVANDQSVGRLMTLAHVFRVVGLTQRLLQVPFVKMAGLGPRDSLRIEAALNLYGQEITEDTSPIAAGLTWCIGSSSSYLTSN
jgi:aminomethyltransferase